MVHAVLHFLTSQVNDNTGGAQLANQTARSIPVERWWSANWPHYQGSGLWCVAQTPSIWSELIFSESFVRWHCTATCREENQKRMQQLCIPVVVLSSFLPCSAFKTTTNLFLALMPIFLEEKNHEISQQRKSINFFQHFSCVAGNELSRVKCSSG